MTNRELDNLKEAYINHLKSYMSETGGLFPHITIFAEHVDKEEEDKPAIIHIPIPDEYMKDDESKDRFVEQLMPELMIEMKKQFIPIGVAWASEAWMRVADKDFDMSKYKSLPKKEVVFMSIETKSGCDTLIYEIKRTGIQVNSEGQLTDRIELEEIETAEKPSSAEGRFAGLYKKLINNDETD